MLLKILYSAFIQRIEKNFQEIIIDIWTYFFYYASKPDTILNQKEANDGGFNPMSVDCETWDHKVYYPSADKLYIRVIADKASKKILGAQLLGAYKTEVSKRIDIFSVAIHHDMTVRDFSNYDLSYTPPLSSPWDPVQIAVQKLEKAI